MQFLDKVADVPVAETVLETVEVSQLQYFNVWVVQFLDTAVATPVFATTGFMVQTVQKMLSFRCSSWTRWLTCLLCATSSS